MDITIQEINDLLLNDNFLKPMELKVTAKTDNEITIEMPFTDNVKRFGGIMNGGAIMALADVAGGFALLFDKDVLNQVTINLSSNFIRPISMGPVVAKGKKLRSGRNIGYSQIDIYDGDGNLCTVATGSWYLYRE